MILVPSGQGKVWKKGKVLEEPNKKNKPSEAEQTEQRVIVLPVTACGSVLWVKNMNNRMQEFNPEHFKAAVI